MILKTLFTDWDDTLHDTGSRFSNPVNNLWEFFNVEIHQKIVDSIRYCGLHKDLRFHCALYLSQQNGDYTEKELETMVFSISKALRECEEKPTFYQDAIDFLELALRNDLKLCLTTTLRAKERALTLEKFLSRRVFLYAFDEDTLGREKNDIRFYLEALKKSGSTASETISMGDSLHDDIIPAKKAGLKTIWVNRNGRRADANKDYVDFEVSDLTKASSILSIHNANGR